MSHIWVFSPSSEEKLRECIAAASPKEDNKWARQFKRDDTLFVEKSNLHDTTMENPEENIEKMDSVMVSETYEDFFDAIEADPLLKMDYIVDECLKNNSLLITIGERLSSNCLEKLCTNILNKKDLNESFLDIFFKYFIPSFIKRQQSLFSLDLLVQAKTHSKFKNLITILLQDLETPSKLLQDFVMTLNEVEKANFISNITQIDLPYKNFTNHIFTIYLAYKDCIKSDHIQNYIFAKLKQNGQYCTTERHYGRLFLTYLQAEKASGHNIDVELIKELLEMHKSPFKKPCLNVLNEINEINSSK